MCDRGAPVDAGLYGRSCMMLAHMQDTALYSHASTEASCTARQVRQVAATMSTSSALAETARGRSVVVADRCPGSPLSKYATARQCSCVKSVHYAAIGLDTAQ